MRYLTWDEEIDGENIDGTRNEVHVKGVDVRSFPTARFILKGRRERSFELTVDGDGYQKGGSSEVVDVIE